MEFLRTDQLLNLNHPQSDEADLTQGKFATEECTGLDKPKITYWLDLSGS